MHVHSAVSAFPIIRLRNNGGEPGGSPSVWATLPLGGFARDDPVARRRVDVEGPNDGGSLKEGREHLLDLGIRHRKAARTLAHLNFASKTRTVASVCLVGFFPVP